MGDSRLLYLRHSAVDKKLFFDKKVFGLAITFEIRPLAHAQGSAENHSANPFSSLGVCTAQGSAEGETAAPDICAANGVRAAIHYVVREQVDP
jgi:hypothetical protein